MTDVTDVSPSAPDELPPPSKASGWSRRQLLGLTALGGAAAALAACDAVADSPNADLLAIKRATYGPTQAVIDRVAAVGIDDWIAEQLSPETLDTSAVDAKIAQLPALAMTPVELRDNYPDNDIYRAGGELQVGTAIRQLESPAQLYERMVEFWSDHFNAPFSNQIMVLLKIVEDRELIRTHALGTFRDLLVADAT
ncbi:MAG: DUF1800 domain-containing protein, partial [Acidimicrobiia bacterium]|nr:DUF1800 domain-containing protein [Acidimicrobiia bacterium]